MVDSQLRLGLREWMEVSIPERDSEIEADDLRKIRHCPPNVSDMVHGVARMNPGCWVVGVGEGC